MKRATIAALLVGIAAAGSAAEPKDGVVVIAQKRVSRTVAVTTTDATTGKTKVELQVVAAPVEIKASLDPAKTAVVVCDMWDDHWCKSASARCAELARAAEPVLQACREKGMTIIHCPSDCMKFYEDHAAR